MGESYIRLTLSKDEAVRVAEWAFSNSDHDLEAECCHAINCLRSVIETMKQNGALTDLPNILDEASWDRLERELDSVGVELDLHLVNSGKVKIE